MMQLSAIQRSYLPDIPFWNGYARNTNDPKTYGELFFMFCEDIQDMELTDALQSLMALFVEHISLLSADITACIKSKVTD